MLDIEHEDDELEQEDREKEPVVDRRKATRYLNQCSVCVYCASNARHKEELEKPLCVCVPL